MIRNHAEHTLFRHCARRGMNPRWTPPTADILHHIDMFVDIDGQAVGLDVKGAGRRSRGDGAYDTQGRWMELRNVKGNRGSLFGTATFMVVATPSGWAWVRRNELMIECVLRHIEGSWPTKWRGQSFIIHVPFTYLLRTARMVWACPFLDSQYADHSKT